MENGFIHSVGTWLGTARHGGMLWLFIAGGLATGIAALALLMSTPPKYRRTVVSFVTLIGGLYFSVEFLIPHKNFLTVSKPAVSDWMTVIGSFALLLGMSNLFQIHGKAVAKRSKGWYNSAAFFVAFFAIMVMGFLRDGASGNLGVVSKQLFTVLFNGFLNPLDATMFSLIAFYIVSAAYRAFRIRSVESALMMLTAATIMLALVPVGVWLTHWIPASGPLAMFRIERIGYWLLTWPNMAVQRAIAFGIAVGSLAMGLRIWLSLEKGSFFDKQL
jgi:hypothetical protein